MYPWHHDHALSPLFGFQRKTYHSSRHPISWQASAGRRFRTTGGVLLKECISVARQSRSAGAHCHSGYRRPAPLETANAPFHCRRNHLLHATPPFRFLKSKMLSRPFSLLIQFCRSLSSNVQPPAQRAKEKHTFSASKAQFAAFRETSCRRTMHRRPFGR